MLKSRAIPLALVAGLSLTSVVSAQNNPVKENPVKVQVGPRQGVQVEVGRPGQQPQAQQGALDLADRQIAHMLNCADDIEIAVSKLVVSKAKNAEVKKFAEKMVEEHTVAKGKLAALLQADNSPQPDGPRANQPQPRNDPQATQPNQPRNGTAQRVQRAGLDMNVVGEELKVATIKAAQDELEKKDGRELDACFIGHQIVCHQEALVKLSVLEKHASPALKAHMDERQQTIESHLKLAKDIMKKIDESPKTAANN